MCVYIRKNIYYPLSNRLSSYRFEFRCHKKNISYLINVLIMEDNGYNSRGRPKSRWMNYVKQYMSKKGVRSICDTRVIEEYGKLITPTLNKDGTRYDDDVDTRLSDVWSIFFSLSFSLIAKERGT